MIIDCIFHIKWGKKASKPSTLPVSGKEGQKEKEPEHKLGQMLNKAKYSKVFGHVKHLAEFRTLNRKNALTFIH